MASPGKFRQEKGKGKDKDKDKGKNKGKGKERHGKSMQFKGKAETWKS